MRLIYHPDAEAELIEAHVRRYPMRRFPYFIYYRALPDHVRILAFAHHRRHPEYWRERLA
jgi:toxin ParE1/3/4